MLRLVLVADRTLTLIRALAVAVACAIGCYVFFGVVDDKYPVAQWLSVHLWPVWAYTLLFNAACVAGGAGLIDALFPRRRFPALEWLVLSMGVGLVLFVLGMYLAGASCRFKPITACVLPALMLVLGFRGTRRLAAALRNDFAAKASLSARAAAFVAAGFGATCLAFLYLEALDPSSINFDATWYHYPIAQDYARTGCLIPFPGDHHRTYPHLTSIVHTWALLVPGIKILPAHWMLSLHLEYSIVVWRVVGVAAAIRWALYGQRTPGAWAVFFLFPSLFVYDQNIGGSADHFLGFFAIPILLAAARALSRFEWRWAIVLGIVMGGHLLTKYQGLYLLVGTTLVVVVRWGYVLALHALRRKRSPLGQRQRRLRRLLLAPALAMGVAIVVTAPHFVKNAVFYHNPLYPYARNVFKGSWPNVDPDGLPVRESDSAAEDDEAASGEAPSREAPAPAPPPAAKSKSKPFAPKHQGLKRQLWSLQQLYEYSFSTHNRTFTDHRPYMGALFSLLLPCLLFVRRSKRIWFATLLGAAAFMVWANTAVNDRYLLSFYDLFIASAGALMVRAWELGTLARIGLVPLVASQFFWGGDAMLFYGAKRLREAIGIVSDGYAGKSIESRLAAQAAQQRLTAATPRDAVILSRNYKGLLGLDRTVLNDIRGAQYYISYGGLRSAAELWSYLRERGVTHLLYPEGQRVPVRLNNEVLFADLFKNGCENPQRFSNLRLATLRQTPPAAEVPTLVLVRKLRGYKDGVYRVEQLDVDSARTAPPPQPVEAYDGSEEQLNEVRAVVLGPGGQLGGAQQELERGFEQFEHFSQYTLYLRRGQ